MGNPLKRPTRKRHRNLTLKVDFGDWYWGWFLIPPFWADFWWFGMIFSHSSINFCVDTWMNGNGRVNACTGAESSFFSCWCQETFWSWQFYRTWNEHHCWPVYLSGQPIFSRSLGPKIQGVYFPEPNRLQFSLTAEVVREICQHIYDSAARLQDMDGELVLPSLHSPILWSQLLSSPMKTMVAGG